MSRRSGRRAAGGINAILSASDFTGIAAGGLAGGSGAGTAFESATGLRLTRASAGTVQTGDATIVSGLGNDAGRFGRANNSWNVALVLEESRTNVASASNVASWSPTNVTLATSTGPDADAASAGTVTDASAVAAGYATATVGGSTGTAYSDSVWVKNVSGSAGVAITLSSNDTINGGYVINAVARPAYADWTRVVQTGTQTSGTSTTWVCQPAVPSASYLGAAQFFCVQKEAGSFATEAIITSGSPLTRAVDILWMQTGANALDAGCLSVSYKLRAKGGGGSYSANMSLWYVDANNQCYVDYSTRQINVIIGGVTWTSDAMASWSANDVLEIFVSGGGGTWNTTAAYRVNGGSLVPLGASLAPHAALSIAGSLYLLNNSTAGVFTSWVESITFYKAGYAPAWVSGYTRSPGDFTTNSVGYLAGGTATGNAFSSATGFRLTRASAGTVQTSESTFDSSNSSNDAARFGKAQSAWNTGLVIEESRTNYAYPTTCPASITGTWTLSANSAADSVALPNGSTGGARATLVATQYSDHCIHTGATSGSWTATEWFKRRNSSPAYQHRILGVSNASVTVANYSTDTWRKMQYTITGGAGGVGSIVDARVADNPSYDGNPIDLNRSFAQIESGAFATENIITTVASATRAIDVCYHPSPGTTYCSDGKYRFEISFRPKGAIGEYPSYGVLFHCPAPTAIQFVKNSGANTCYLTSGAANSNFPTPLSWAALDLVDLYVEWGGGVKPIAYYRLNGGAAVSLGTPDAVLSTVVITTPLYLLSQNTLYHVSAWLYRFKAYATGTKPVWVP